MTSRSQRRRSRQRQRLIDAARRIIAQKGLAGLTVQAVTEEADMAVGSFYTYFPNKEALIEAAIWDDLKRLGEPDDLLAQGLPLDQVHAQRLLRIFQFFEDHRDLMRAVFGPDGAPEQFNRGVKLMETTMAATMEEELGLPAEATSWIAALLSGMIAGGLRYLLEHPEVSAQEMTQRMLTLLHPLHQHPWVQDREV